MCGITGFVNFDNLNNYQNVLKEMANSIEFRGPDNTNFYFDQENHVALGHNRLSIIDLNERSNQPLKKVIMADILFYLMVKSIILDFLKKR